MTALKIDHDNYRAPARGGHDHRRVGGHRRPVVAGLVCGAVRWWRHRVMPRLARGALCSRGRHVWVFRWRSDMGELRECRYCPAVRRVRPRG
jgi:hypothetical protein